MTKDAKLYDAKTVNKKTSDNRDEDERAEKEIRDLIEKTFKGEKRDRALDWLKRKAVWPATL